MINIDSDILKVIENFQTEARGRLEKQRIPLVGASSQKGS